MVPGANVPIMSGDMGDGGTPELAPQAQVPDVAQLDQAAGLNQPPPPARSACRRTRSGKYRAFRNTGARRSIRDSRDAGRDSSHAIAGRIWPGAGAACRHSG